MKFIYGHHVKYIMQNCRWIQRPNNCYYKSYWRNIQDKKHNIQIKINKLKKIKNKNLKNINISHIADLSMPVLHYS